MFYLTGASAGFTLQAGATIDPGAERRASMEEFCSFRTVLPIRGS